MNAKTTLTLVASACAFAAAAALPTTASAGEAKTVKVIYGDLDLSSTAGQEVFDRRIERAIERVCGRTVGVTQSIGSSTYKCQHETKASVKASRDLAVANYKKDRLAGKGKGEIRIAVK